MEINAKIKRDALKALHKVQIAAARNIEAARAQNNQIALGFWDRMDEQASNLAFQIQYGEDQ